jgi:Caspase domain/MORN repeat
MTADQVLVAMEKTGTPTKVIILDACRNNPVFTSGLASVEPKASYGGGTFFAYSTQPKNVAQDGTGRNSPYTESLLQFINQPNLPIEMLFKKVRSAVAEKTAGKQIPWENNALLGGDLCLAGCFSASSGSEGGSEGGESSSGYCTTKVGQGLYQGQCQDGLPEGQGVMKYQSGEYYQGSFRNGLRDGPGVQYLTDGNEIRGNFCQGRFCN